MIPQTFFGKNVRLENDRVLLLPFDHPRNTELVDIIFDDDIWSFMGMYVRTTSDLNSYISNIILEKQKGLSVPFLIIDKLNDKVAGSTRFGNIKVGDKKCEIGWTWYGKEFQGTGLNRACKYELLSYGFDELRWKRIQFSADSENIKSQRAILKLGARQEGVFRNNYIDSEGNSRDDVYFSIIDSDWSSLKKSHFPDF